MKTGKKTEPPATRRRPLERRRDGGRAEANYFDAAPFASFDAAPLKANYAYPIPVPDINYQGPRPLPPLERHTETDENPALPAVLRKARESPPVSPLWSGSRSERDGRASFLYCS